MWTKTSLPPSSGWIKPKPLVGLNHFTVPVAMDSSLSDRWTPAPRGGDQIFVELETGPRPIQTEQRKATEPREIRWRENSSRQAKYKLCRWDSTTAVQAADPA